MKYGLTSSTIQAIQDVFAGYLQVEKAVLYGSRAKGNYRNGSDIDLVLWGQDLDLSLLFRIETQLDDLLLPYKIDLSLYDHIANPELREHIQRVGKVFWQRAEEGASNATAATASKK
jgi:predicted nucleotidyltransferase